MIGENQDGCKSKMELEDCFGDPKFFKQLKEPKRVTQEECGSAMSEFDREWGDPGSHDQLATTLRKEVKATSDPMMKSGKRRGLEKALKNRMRVRQLRANQGMWMRDGDVQGITSANQDASPKRKGPLELFNRHTQHFQIQIKKTQSEETEDLDHIAG